jgi:hypothetical protein
MQRDEVHGERLKLDDNTEGSTSKKDLMPAITSTSKETAVYKNGDASSCGHGRGGDEGHPADKLLEDLHHGTTVPVNFLKPKNINLP